ncbi:MAG TPA: MFS transporter [Sphingobium sp.]
MTKGNSSTAWRMVALSFIAQNFAIGISFGSLGPILVYLEHASQVSRSMSSLGSAILTVTMALAAPAVGFWLRKHSSRSVMMTGAILSCVGYLILSRISDVLEFAVIFGVLIGAGNTMLAAVTPSTLISRWFDVKSRGRALGIMSLPVFLLFTPVICTRAIAVVGITPWFIAVGLSFGLLAVLMLAIVDPPQAADAEVTAVGASQTGPSKRSKVPFKDARFWILTLCAAQMTATTYVFLTHAVPFAVNVGIADIRAGLLVSTFALSGIAGNLIVGPAADKFGPVRMVAVSTGVQAIAWAGLTVTTSFELLLALSAILGFLSTSTTPLHCNALSVLFGSDSVGPALGAGYIVKLPFMFGYLVLAAHLFDVTGAYVMPFEIMCGALAAACLGAVAIFVMSRRQGTQHGSRAPVGRAISDPSI